MTAILSEKDLNEYATAFYEGKATAEVFRFAAEVIALRAECGALRSQRNALTTRVAEFKSIGQQFEHDARKHFDQGCQNLQRAHQAEAELSAEKSAHAETAKRLEAARRSAIMECAFVFDDRPDIRTAERRIAALLKGAALTAQEESK